MRRFFYFLISTGLLSIGLLSPAGEEPGTGKRQLKPLDLGEENPPAPKNLELDTDKPEDGKTQEDEPETSKEVMARIVKNMMASEENLKNKKTGEETQEYQQKIIEDLDKLIQQQNSQKNKSGGGGKSSSSSQGQSTKPNQQNPNSQNQNQNSKPSPNQNPKPSSKNSPKTGSEPKSGKPGGPKKQPQPGKGTKPGLGQKSQDPKPQQGKNEERPNPAVGKQPPKGKDNDVNDPLLKALNKKEAQNKLQADILAELNREEAINLPKKKRMELNAYFQYRYMERHEARLKHFYSSIAEKE